MLANLSRAFKLRNTNLSLFTRNINSWSSSIKTASSPNKALQIYTQMHRNSVPFDSFSILFTLKSFARLRELTLLQHLHAHILKIGFNDHVYVGTSLLYGYVIASFDDACVLFDEMPERNTVTWNTMITGYSKVGDLNKALLMFEEMPVRDIASWSAMIAGYIGVNKWYEGFSLFREMVIDERLNPDDMVMGSILSGCAHMGSLGLIVGKSVHGYMVKNMESKLNVGHGSALVDMYAKCGFLKCACQVFATMQERNVMSWTSLICGAAQHGWGKEALSIFQAMQDSDISPNELTFTGILNACAQTGLVEEGRKYFCMIEGRYGLEPRIQHYGCMVDMYGKAGMLENAYEVIKTMKLEPNVFVWCSFLSACKVHKQFEMAERVIEHILELVKPENDGGVYTLICDIYVLEEKWDAAERVRKLMAHKNVKKVRGFSYIKSD